MIIRPECFGYACNYSKKPKGSSLSNITALCLVLYPWHNVSIFQRDLLSLSLSFSLCLSLSLSKTYHSKRLKLSWSFFLIWKWMKLFVSFEAFCWLFSDSCPFSNWRGLWTFVLRNYCTFVGAQMEVLWGRHIYGTWSTPHGNWEHLFTFCSRNSPKLTLKTNPTATSLGERYLYSTLQYHRQIKGRF